MNKILRYRKKRPKRKLEIGFNFKYKIRHKKNRSKMKLEIGITIDYFTDAVLSVRTVCLQIKRQLVTLRTRSPIQKSASSRVRELLQPSVASTTKPRVN